MTYISKTTIIADTTSIFTRVVLGLRKLLEVAGSAGMPEEVQASGLSPRLSYDVGLSDLCPDRMVSTSCGVGSGDISREMMRRGY